jgi:hypothetical protein
MCCRSGTYISTSLICGCDAAVQHQAAANGWARRTPPMIQTSGAAAGQTAVTIRDSLVTITTHQVVYIASNGACQSPAAQPGDVCTSASPLPCFILSSIMPFIRPQNPYRCSFHVSSKRTHNHSTTGTSTHKQVANSNRHACACPVCDAACPVCQAVLARHSVLISLDTWAAPQRLPLLSWS